MDISKLNCVLIQNNNHIETEQRILNGLYEKLSSRNFEYSENIYLPYITQYLKEFDVDKKESFCVSKKSGKTGMRTGYLIDSLNPSSKNSAIVCIDKDTDDVLGVLTFNYIEWSDKDHAYDNSLYIDAFCTNQQIPTPGIGKLLLTTIIEATTDLRWIDNIFLEAATRSSEGFYEKFNFEFTGVINDKMREYKYSINGEPEKNDGKEFNSYGGKRTMKNKKNKKNKKITRKYIKKNKNKNIKKNKNKINKKRHITIRRFTSYAYKYPKV